MKKENKLIKAILCIGIFVLILEIILIIFLALTIYCYIFYKKNGYSLAIDFGFSFIFWLFFSISLGTLLISFIMNLTISIIILTYKWKNQWIVDYKMMWGLLILFLLWGIGMIIFARISKKHSLTESHFSFDDLLNNLKDKYNPSPKKETFSDEY